MPQNGSQYLYFIQTLSLDMKQIQIQAPQNGYSAQERHQISHPNL